ncbi:MAG TPA: aminotransferase class V-fold PLP-dependent enzyme [Candidatus Paceibacterota bacterium]|nr:aminotransferase class V-fold PLP-dependent enzyme [Candidatus Paceibacterota bacterium]
MQKQELRDVAPLLDSYLSYLESFEEGARQPFTTPGHKQRAHLLDEGLGQVVDRDVPLFGGLDDVKLTHGVLLEAEALAARLWGGDWARFSTGGSTHANQAILLSLGKPGDKVAMTRTAHRSQLTALVLAGLEPLWLSPDIDVATGVPTGISLSEFERVLPQKPIALLLTEPGYLGTLSDIPPLIKSAHDRGIPVILDAAWGGHFGFHPALPKNPMQLGADAFVTSIHKALPGYSASAIAVARTRLLNRARLEQGFESTHTTSPAGAPLASIDAVRALMEHHGSELLERLLANVDLFRRRLTEEFGDEILLSPSNFASGRFDPAKIVVRADVLGANGLTIERDLASLGVTVEMADRDNLVIHVTIADDIHTLTRLAEGLIPILKRNSGPRRKSHSALSWSIKPTIAMSLREAYFAESEMVSARDAIGRISADLIAPYPPGVAVLAPGEIITQTISEGLISARSDGVRIAYASDPSLRTFRVLTSQSERATS